MTLLCGWWLRMRKDCQANCDNVISLAHRMMAAVLKRRAALAEGIFREIRRTILPNRCIPLHDKVSCVEGMVVDKFMHNSGVWHFHANTEQTKSHATGMSFWRRRIWPACGFPPQFLRDVEASVVLHILLPEELLDIRRVRQLCTNSNFGVTTCGAP